MSLLAELQEIASLPSLQAPLRKLCGKHELICLSTYPRSIHSREQKVRDVNLLEKNGLAESLIYFKRGGIGGQGGREERRKEERKRKKEESLFKKSGSELL